MPETDEWSPDEPSGDQSFEQGDEALDDATALDPGFLEAVEIDPSLDPTLQGDQRELAEVGAEFDDPESIGTLDGGIDDPDGVDPAPEPGSDDDGWDLDAPITRGDAEPT